MAQDRTRDRTQTAGVQMADDRMPEGQAPANIPPGERQRMTKDQVRQRSKQAMLEDVFANKSEFMKFLASFGVDYDVFEAGLKVFLMRQERDNPEFFDGCDQLSFMTAMSQIAMLGLVPDGKEAAIAIFKGKATAMIGRDGFVKAYWRTGMIKSINDNVVTRPEYEMGWFTYIEGDGGYIQHQMDLERKDTDDTMAAYCIIELTTGGVMREVVPKADLDKIAKMSRSPARGAWKFQMDKKAALRRINTKMPKEIQAAIAPLLEVDDQNYDLKAVNAIEGAKRVDRAALFSDKAQHRAKPKPKPEPAAEEERAAQQAPVEQPQDQEAPAGEPELAQEFVTAILHAADLKALGDLKAKAAATEGFSDDERDWIDETLENRGRELAGAGGAPSEESEEEAATDPDAPPPELRAIISTLSGMKVYDDPNLWRDDILAKMNAVTGPSLKAFWAKNFGFLEAARPIAPAQVERIFEVAASRGISHG